MSIIVSLEVQSILKEAKLLLDIYDIKIAFLNFSGLGGLFVNSPTGAAWYSNPNIYANKIEHMPAVEFSGLSPDDWGFSLGEIDDGVLLGRKWVYTAVRKSILKHEGLNHGE